MPTLSPHGRIAGWCIAAVLAAPAAVASTPSPSGDGVATEPSPAAFDAAFQHLLQEGMGTTPAEGEAGTRLLAVALPKGDAFRQRRFDAMTCSAPRVDRPAAFAEAEARLGREKAQPTPDPTNLALLHLCRAAFRPQTDVTADMRADYDAAVAEAERSGNPLLLGQMLSGRAGLWSLEGEFAKALIDALAAQRQLEASGDAFATAANIQSVGIAFRRMGEHARAAEYLLKSLDNPEIQSRWSYRLVSLLQLAYLYEETQRYGEAREMLKQAIEVCTENNSRADCGYARLALASVEANDGGSSRVLRLLERADEDFKAAGDTGDPTMSALVRGQALVRLGRDAEALAMFDQAVATWTAEENTRYLSFVLPERAKLLERLGRHGAALADLQRFIDAHLADDRKRAEQRTEFMREEFDASRRELENAELKAREALRLKEIEGLNVARRWQWTAIAMGGALLLVLAGIVIRQIRKARRLRLLAMTDPLTGLANRRHTDYRGSEDFKLARLSGQPFCVLAIDIDHFKQVNDTHGHAVGDTVLQRVGRECQRTLRKLDLMGRIGGEEFTGLLPETDEPAARLVAERLRAGVEELALDDVVPGLRVTISVGIAQMRPDDPDFAAVLARADAAMYRAKQAGRNRVVSDETA